MSDALDELLPGTTPVQRRLFCVWFRTKYEQRLDRAAGSALVETDEEYQELAIDHVAAVLLGRLGDVDFPLESL